MLPLAGSLYQGLVSTQYSGRSALDKRGLKDGIVHEKAKISKAEKQKSYYFIIFGLICFITRSL